MKIASPLHEQDEVKIKFILLGIFAKLLNLKSFIIGIYYLYANTNRYRKITIWRESL
jgi:hypothetical protein